MDDRLTAEQTRLWRAFRATHERLAAVLGRRLSADVGLSPPEFRVLGVLEELGQGVARQADVLASTGWDKSRLSHLLRRMEARGLVARRPTSTASGGPGARGASARAADVAVTVAVTTAGRARYRAARQVHARAVREHFFDRLPPADAAALAGVLDRLTASDVAGPGAAVRAGRRRPARETPLRTRPS